jgi:hypothetical protein
MPDEISGIGKTKGNVSLISKNAMSGAECEG